MIAAAMHFASPGAHGQPSPAPTRSSRSPHDHDPHVAADARHGIKAQLPFADKRDFDEAARGFVVAGGGYVDLKSNLVAGNNLIDIDQPVIGSVTQLGTRRDLGSAGVLQGGFPGSGVPTRVWEDPYAEGVRRKETDRDSTGARLMYRFGARLATAAPARTRHRP